MTYKSDNHSYDIPESEEPNWDVPLQKVLEGLDTDVIIKDTFVNRPGSPKSGTWFLATDRNALYRYDGSWQFIMARSPPSEKELHVGGIQTGLDATTTGVKYDGEMRQLVDAAALNPERSVYIEGATTSSNTDAETVGVEVYDDTAGAVAASLSIVGGSSRARSADISSSLTAGNEVHVRYNVTTASTDSGATFDAVGARLVIK